MKLKDILYKNYSDLKSQEKRFYTLNQEKFDGQTETFDGMNVVVHYMRIPVDMCKCCLENR